MPPKTSKIEILISSKKFYFVNRKLSKIGMVCLYGKSDCYGVSTTFISMSSVRFRYIIMMKVNN